MGLAKLLFGGGVTQIANGVKAVAGVFSPNAEASDKRDASYNTAALAQYAAEFHARQNRTWFDSLVDGLNRLVRPVTTIGVLCVIPATIIYPEQTSVAFAALALLPAGYWAIVGVIVSFYYGGRMQIKSQEFEKSITNAVARAPQVIKNIEKLRDHLSPGEAKDGSTDVALEISGKLPVDNNPAINDWQTKTTINTKVSGHESKTSQGYNLQ